MHIFTSITSNYLPKARVLAHSVKRHRPDAIFHLVLNDRAPDGFDLADEPFDQLLPLEQLPLGTQRDWLFGHTVVELCTAVKAMAFLAIADRHDADRIFYLDPDIVVFDDLRELEGLLDTHAVLLTPHQTEPETELAAVADHEIASLKHGVYNLGFLGVRPQGEGRRFLEWWDRRLRAFCHDDIPNGLFTDQRWIDLAPVFFEGVHIVRSPRFNVATWNLTHRQATGSLDGGIRINGQPLGFYHFSGFDGGAQEIMLNLYGQSSPVLFDLRRWYIASCAAQGQSQLGQRRAALEFYADGTPIDRQQRILYRNSPFLRERFPDPYAVPPDDDCYLNWYRRHIGGPVPEDSAHTLLPDMMVRTELDSTRTELEQIKNSRSWRLARRIAGFAGALKRVGRS